MFIPPIYLYIITEPSTLSISHNWKASKPKISVDFSSRNGQSQCISETQIVKITKTAGFPQALCGNSLFCFVTLMNPVSFAVQRIHCFYGGCSGRDSRPRGYYHRSDIITRQILSPGISQRFRTGHLPPYGILIVRSFHRHGFREISRFIYVKALGHRRIVGQKLQRNDDQAGRKALEGLRHIDRKVRRFLHLVIAVARDA